MSCHVALINEILVRQMLRRLVISLIGLAAAPCIMAQGIVTYQGLRLTSSDSPANAISLLPPAGITPYTLTLPTSAGNNGAILTTSSSGQLSWSAGASTSLSSLTGATGTSSISLGTFKYQWGWDTIANRSTVFTLSSNSTAAASNAQTLLTVNHSGSWGAVVNGRSECVSLGSTLLDENNPSTGTPYRQSNLIIDVTNGSKNYALIVRNGMSGLRTYLANTDPFTPTARLHIGSPLGPPLGHMRFTSGTLLTTPQVGAWEYDGSVLYSAVADNNRGVIPSESFMVLFSDNTLTSQTAAQPLFDGGGGTTNGRVTLAAGTYEFECMLYITGLSATGSFGFQFGGTATIGSQRWSTIGRKPLSTEAVTVNGVASGIMATAADAQIVTSNNGTNGYVYITGVLRLTAGGTLTPQITLETAAAAVVKKNSYFIIAPIGNSTVTRVGNWE